MANYHSTNKKPLYKSSKRSAIDAYLPEQPSSIPSSRYLSSFTDPTSLSSNPSPSSFSYYSQSRTPVSAIDVPAATSGIGASSRTFYPTSTASPIWPSFDVSATPSEALYDHSGDAWLTYNSLAKRPRLENASSLHNYPLRPGEKDCSHYMLTRTCKFGDNCKYDHPIWVPIGGIPDWKEPLSIPSHPERPGEPDCPYFVKTQKCKYGLHCRFNHPKDKVDTSSKTDAPDLPERPSEPVCTFYAKTGMCKYGAACKYHHPKDIQVPSAAQVNVDGVHIQSKDHIGANGDGDALKYMVSNPASSYNTKGLPMRPGQDDCPFYMKTGSCKYGANCRYNHPDWNVINPAAAVVHHAVLPSLGNSVGFGNPASFLQNLQSGLSQTTFGQVPAMYPQRPGQMECDYYMKNGECKYGERCKYHHPIDRYAPTSNQSLGQNVKITLAGLPRREGAEHCPFYMKTGTCKYGVNCKFDHPPPGEVMASADKESPTKAEEKEKEIGEILETEDKPENGEMSENVEKSENVAADEK